MNLKLAQIAQKIKVIKRRTPAYAEVAQWMGDLLSETERAAEKFSTPDLNLGPKNLSDVESNGRPFLDPSKLPLDWDQAEALYRRLVRLVEARKEGHRQAAGLMKAIAGGRKDFCWMMKAVLSSDLALIEATAGVLNVDPALLYLLFHMALRPALLNVARFALVHMDLSTWPYGHCPVCGSAPKLASLSVDEGKRRLHCSLCETAWSYPRLQCPFCKNNNPHRLDYLRAEEEKGLRVDLCKDCGQYIKTLDLRELSGPVIVHLDDVATWHLDLMAASQG